jgi:hypothetical protein
VVQSKETNQYLKLNALLIRISTFLHFLATSGNYAGIIESGNRIDFAKSKWILKGNCDSNTYLTVKIGVGVDHANDADTTNAVP